MKTRLLTTILACFLVTSAFSQSELNNYKYIIVSKKFDFLKEANQYQLNDLSKFLFNKYGFEAFVEGETYPEDLMRNRCLALDADVKKDPGMFKTKLTVELSDCNDHVVYTSGIGESREKEYKTAYTEAVRGAFESLESLDYKYTPKAGNSEVSAPVAAVTQTSSKEIEKLKEEIEALKKEKEAVVVKEIPAPVETIVEVKEEVTMTATDAATASGVLYAQAIKNGFQLVDSTPKVLYKMHNTGLEGVFLVENQSAIIFKKGDSWFLEQHANGTMKLSALNIKF